MTHQGVYGTVFNTLLSFTSEHFGMNLAEQNAGRKWTYADYGTWPDDRRWELIDGVAYAISGAPDRYSRAGQIDVALLGGLPVGLADVLAQ